MPPSAGQVLRALSGKARERTSLLQCWPASPRQRAGHENLGVGPQCLKGKASACSQADVGLREGQQVPSCGTEIPAPGGSLGRGAVWPSRPQKAGAPTPCEVVTGNPAFPARRGQGARHWSQCCWLQSQLGPQTHKTVMGRLSFCCPQSSPEGISPLIFRVKRSGREREGPDVKETHPLAASHRLGIEPAARYLPLPGIEPKTLQSAG